MKDGADALQSILRNDPRVWWQICSDWAASAARRSVDDMNAGFDVLAMSWRTS
jgi:hypothetical protein